MTNAVYKRRPGKALAAISAAILVAGVASTATSTATPIAKAAQLPQSITPAQLQGALAWNNVGPLIGGRSIAASGSAARPNEYYFGATGGGVWKTANGGNTWNPVSDKSLTSSSVGAIAVCPADPDVVYAGTGEADLRTNTVEGDGIYKTVDAGKTWTHIGLADTQVISRIAVDPSDCNHVNVAALGHPFGPNTQRGVFRTIDGGLTWTKVLFVDDTTGAADVELDPGNPQIVYASMWHVTRTPWSLTSGGPGDGLWKSTDGGDHWSNLSSHPGFPAAPLGRIGVSVSPVNHNRVWAIVEANVGEGGGVFLSDDGGASWKLTTANAELSQRPFYFFHIFADPQDINTVYVTSLDMWKSTDGGKTFTQIPGSHGDKHDLWIDPTNPQRMIQANDGGGTVSTNGGQTWTAENYPTAQDYHVTTTNDVPYLVCGEQQDSSGSCVPSNGNGSQRFDPSGGEGGQCAVDQRHSEISAGGILYCGERRGIENLYAFNATYGVLTNHQVRNIGIWPDDPTGHPARDSKERQEWSAPVITSPADPNAVYTASQHVFRSTDEGHSWQQLSPDLTRDDPSTMGDSGGPINPDQSSGEYFGTVYTVAPSPVRANVIWAGSDDGLVHVTRDNGNTWTDVTPPGLPHVIRMALIDASPYDPGTAYLAAENHRQDDFQPYLFKTTDYGQHWTKITTGIAANDFPWVIRQDPVDPDLLYAGTDHGMYFSLDNGANWQPLQLNLPDTPVTDIVTHGDDLLISTFGRSFWVMHGLSLLRQLAPTAMAQPAHLFTPAPDQLGQDRGLDVDYNLNAAASHATLQFVASDGRTLDSVTVNGQPGLHRYTWTPPQQAASITVRLTTPGATQQQPATVLPDPAGSAVSFAPAPSRPSAATPNPAQSVSNTGAVLFQPANPTRSVDPGVNVSYQLNQAASSVSMTFLDSQGHVVRTFTGLPTGAGAHSFLWNLQYPGPVTVPGISSTGPKAPLGGYTAELTVDTNPPLSQPFTILKDPRLKTVSGQDILRQFQFGEQVVARTSAADQAVLNIQACGTQIDERIASANDPQVTASGHGAEGQLNEVSDALNQTNQQEDKFPVRLNDKIRNLLSVSESADGVPTEQTQQVFQILNEQLTTQLTNLGGIIKTDIPPFNNLLQQHGLPPVSCQA